MADKKNEEKIRLEITRPPSTVEIEFCKVRLELVTVKGSSVFCDDCCTWCHKLCLGIFIPEVTSLEWFCSAFLIITGLWTPAKFLEAMLLMLYETLKRSMLKLISHLLIAYMLTVILPSVIERLNDQKILFLIS